VTGAHRATRNLRLKLARAYSEEKRLIGLSLINRPGKRDSPLPAIESGNTVDHDNRPWLTIKAN